MAQRGDFPQQSGLLLGYPRNRENGAFDIPFRQPSHHPTSDVRISAGTVVSAKMVFQIERKKDVFGHRWLGLGRERTDWDTSIRIEVQKFEGAEVDLFRVWH